MDKNQLKNILASMDADELAQLLTEVKNYVTTSSKIDSIKKLFDLGYILEFQMENGEHILVNKFINSTLTDDKLCVLFNVFGINDNINIAVYFNINENLILNNTTPSLTFVNKTPIYLIINNNSQALLNAVTMTVCKLQRGVYEVEPEGIKDKSSSKIKTSKQSKRNKNSSDTQKDEYIPPIKEESKFMSIFNAISNWLKNDKHKVLVDISRNFTYNDGHTTSKSHNNFSMLFKNVFITEDNKIRFDDCIGNTGSFVINPEEFINGSINWEDTGNRLIIVNKDKTFNIKISFMNASKTLNVNDDSLKSIKNISI